MSAPKPIANPSSSGNHDADRRPHNTNRRYMSGSDPTLDQLTSFPQYGAVEDGQLRSYSKSPMAKSFTDTLESIVGSYTRTELSYLTENLIPSAGDKSPLLAEEEQLDQCSIRSGSYTLQYNTRQNLDQDYLSLPQKTPSTHFPDDQSSLLSFATNLQKTLTGHNSVRTIGEHGGKSTFTQSVFNSTNILIGVGILAMPLGLARAGWILGMFVFAFCFGLTNYTAKLLAECLDSLPGSLTYGDMGAAAFGVRGRVLVSVLFLIELVAASVGMVVLFCDGIDALFPGHSSISIRLFAFVILTPMLFVPVRHLSYASIMGITIALGVMAVVVYDGLSKPDAPGSLYEPAETTLWPIDWWAAPLSFGLLMSGFAGHSVFPTIYRDMKQPSKYNSMVNWTYVTTAIIYFIVTVSGYLMFGTETMQEITQNLIAIPEYNQAINRLVVWLVAINPVAKYALSLSPINLSWEIALFGSPTVQEWCAKYRWRHLAVTMLGKVLVSATIVTLSYLLPEFDKVMALLGAFFAFMISAIFPLTCHLKLFRHTMSPTRKAVTYVLITISIAMASTGTIRSFF